MSFQVDLDSPLYATASDAAAQWSVALGLPVTVSPDGDIPIFLTEQPSCPMPETLEPGQKVGACALDIGSPDQRIEVPAYLPSSHWLTALLHEMGHHLRGLTRKVHSDDPNGLMYAHLQNGRTITASDVAFICEAQTQPDEAAPLDCHPPDDGATEPLP